MLIQVRKSIELDEEELLSAKNEIILDIKRRWQNVRHVIFRWGLEEKEAPLLEATLIDKYIVIFSLC